MLDARMRKLIDPPLTGAGLWLARLGVSANALTLAGLALGLLMAAMLAAGFAALALVPLASSISVRFLSVARPGLIAPRVVGRTIEVPAEVKIELSRADDGRFALTLEQASA